MKLKSAPYVVIGAVFVFMVDVYIFLILDLVKRN